MKWEDSMIKVDITPWKIVDGKVNVPLVTIREMRFDVINRSYDILQEAGIIPSENLCENIRIIDGTTIKNLGEVE